MTTNDSDAIPRYRIYAGDAEEPQQYVLVILPTEEARDAAFQELFGD